MADGVHGVRRRDSHRRVMRHVGRSVGERRRHAVHGRHHGQRRLLLRLRRLRPQDVRLRIAEDANTAGQR